MNYISSKNILFIAIAAVIIGGAFLFSEYRGDYTKNSLVARENILPTMVTGVATSTVEPINYQGDWQKTLAIGAGSSSWLATPTDDESAYFSPGQTVSGATDLFGKKLFAQYIASKENGDDTSATDTQQYIVSQVMNDGTVLPSPTVYDKSKISITADNSVAAITVYGNSLATIFNKDLSKNQRNELAIVQASLNASDPTVLKELDPIIASYQKTLQDLLKLKTPSFLAASHIALINALSELIFIDQGFGKIYSDGIVSLQSVGVAQKAQTDLAHALQNIDTYFATSGVHFGSNDPGSIFTIQTK